MIFTNHHWQISHMQLYSLNGDTFMMVQLTLGSKFPADRFHVSCFLNVITNTLMIKMINC
jgi:hypothetical protein